MAFIVQGLGELPGKETARLMRCSSGAIYGEEGEAHRAYSGPIMHADGNRPGTRCGAANAPAAHL